MYQETAARESMRAEIIDLHREHGAEQAYHYLLTALFKAWQEADHWQREAARYQELCGAILRDDYTGIEDGEAEPFHAVYPDRPL